MSNRRKKATMTTPAPKIAVSEETMALVGTAPIPAAAKTALDVALFISGVGWSCSCGESWGGRDLEQTVHIHGGYTPGVHHITGPTFRDPAIEAEIRAEWDAESKEALRG